MSTTVRIPFSKNDTRYEDHARMDYFLVRHGFKLGNYAAEQPIDVVHCRWISTGLLEYRFHNEADPKIVAEFILKYGT